MGGWVRPKCGKFHIFFLFFLNTSLIINYDNNVRMCYFHYIPDDEYGEKSVCVSLDGQEAELIFIDHPYTEMSVKFKLNIRGNMNILSNTVY